MRPDLKDVVGYAIGKVLPWSDMDSSLNEKQRKEYSDSALLITETMCFNNELDRLIDEAIKSVVTKATTYDEVRDAQMVVATLQLIKDRFAYIASWNRNKKQASSFEDERFDTI